jgi:hypothetical protein
MGASIWQDFHFTISDNDMLQKTCISCLCLKVLAHYISDASFLTSSNVELHLLQEGCA